MQLAAHPMLHPFITMALGEYIKNRRIKLGLKQQDLALRIAQYWPKTYDKSSIAKWEKNQAMPPVGDPAFVHALAKSLEVSEEEILTVVGLLDREPPDDLPEWLKDGYTKASPEQRKYLKRFLESLEQDQESGE
jgi:transcriptional regulator with XRE-family HTH domain